MLVSAVLVVSLVLQFVAVYLALRLIKITGRSLAWSLIAAAITLMALRRGVSLEHSFASGSAIHADLSVELIALTISILMAFGIERITPIFSKLRATADQLKESEARYRATFENSPVAVWEEDFSQVKQLFDRLRREGVNDLEAHFTAQPQALEQCAALARPVDANRAALRQFGATDKATLLTRLAATFTPETYATFREVLAGVWNGATELRRDTGLKMLSGEPRHVTMTFVVCPGHEATLNRVFVSLVDITEQKRFEQQLRQNLLDTVSAVATTVEMRDPYTAGHQRNVARIVVAIGEELGLPEAQIEGLHLAAIVHDVGKINIAAEILNRPGRLSELEFKLIQVHPNTGYDILKSIDFPWPIAQAVLQHHERLDGSGYPAGLRGDEILPEARILAVADVVEAMASHRPYRPGLGIDAALAEIEAKNGSQFDPDVVAATLRLFRERGFQLAP